jgi:hypothetical protein
MKRQSMSVLLVAFALVCASLGTASVAATPTPSPAPMSATERQFVARVTADLQKRFGSQRGATAAGYYRYTDEDDTGAISWVNTKYWKSDPQHPSQLWYDTKGHLIGVDLSVPKSDSATAPNLWGISPSRWITFRTHDHFGVKNASGLTYGGVGPLKIHKVGGNPDRPTAGDVVKLGRAKSASDVAFVFVFPAIWDLQFWLVPNPNGPFAEQNPNVIPSKAPKSGM